VNSPVSLVAAVGGLFILAIMLAAPWSTRATGQPAEPRARKGTSKAAEPAILAAPAPHASGAHRQGNTSNAEAVAATDLVGREGPRKMFPGKPIKFHANP